MQMHFGEKDDGIPMSTVEESRRSSRRRRPILIRMRHTASLAMNARGSGKKRRPGLEADDGIFDEEYEIAVESSRADDQRFPRIAGPRFAGTTALAKTTAP